VATEEEGNKVGSEPRVVAVVLNWNQWRMTVACLASLGASSFKNASCIVVDNGSADDSVARIRQVCPDAEVIETGTNLGFAAGCNVGIERALANGADYVLLFNNDATLAADALENLVEAARDADAQLVGARVLDEQGEMALFDGRRWPWHIFGLDRVGKTDTSKAWSKSDCLDGCAMLLRRDLLEHRLRVDGFVFDPVYFMYCEDTDLCLFGKKEGSRCIVAHRAIVYHGLAKSSGGVANPRSFYYITRNRIVLARRWLSPATRVIFHVYYLASRLLMLPARTGTVRVAIVEGLRDGYAGVTGIWVRHGT